MTQQYASASKPNYLRNVAVVGGSGRQGRHIVEELLKTGKHQVTILTRSTNGDFPTGARLAVVNYDDSASLVEALKGQDALVITMNTSAPKDTSPKLIEAAAKAGVSWIIPDEWGVDTTNVEFGKEVFLGPAKVAARELIEKLGVSSWTGVACGYWYEYSLGTFKESFGFDLQKREVTFFDDGNFRTIASTHKQVARAVASLVSMKILPENEEDSSICLDRDFKNKFAYIKSFLVSQKDMFASLKRVTSTVDGDWKVDHQSARDRIAEGHKQLSSGDRLGFVKVLYTRTMCFEEGNFELKYKLANEALNLPVEDLDRCTKGAIDLSDSIAKTNQ